MSRALSSRLGHVAVLCSWMRHSTFTGFSPPRIIDGYCCQGNLMKCWGVTCNGLTSHLGRGGGGV